jgi:hypothetical protein
MMVVDDSRLILISCRAAMPAISELLEQDAEHSELVRATYAFVITADRLLEYAQAVAWPGRN